MENVGHFSPGAKTRCDKFVLPTPNYSLTEKSTTRDHSVSTSSYLTHLTEVKAAAALLSTQNTISV